MTTTILHGSCIEVMRTFDAESIDAIVTDPPYGLEFMGKDWDSFKTYAGGNPNMKPQATTVGNSSGVTYGYRQKNPRCRRCGKLMRGNGACKCPEPQIDTRTAESANQFQAWCEDWAAEAWRVLKPGGHMLAFGGTRTWHRLAVAVEDAGFEIRDSIAWLYGSGFPKSLDVSKAIDKAAGAEREVVGLRDNKGRKSADGWGMLQDAAGDPLTAPATPDAERWQGWGTALKPAFEPVVVARKPLTGTVAANVLQHGTGALNIAASRIGTDPVFIKGGGAKYDAEGNKTFLPSEEVNEWRAGRWPANVVLDEHTAPLVDEQSAGASRFFYVAKAPTRERPRVDGIAHPTVKPLTLMRWLVRLVTPPGGTVLDPFAGSGTTIEAALLEGLDSIGIEMTAEYLPLIQQRIDRAGAA